MEEIRNAFHQRSGDTKNHQLNLAGRCAETGRNVLTIPCITGLYSEDHSQQLQGIPCKVHDDGGKMSLAKRRWLPQDSVKAAYN